MKLLDKAALEYIVDARENYSDEQIGEYLTKQGYVTARNNKISCKEVSAHAIQYGVYKKNRAKPISKIMTNELTTNELAQVLLSNCPKKIKLKLLERIL